MNEIVIRIEPDGSLLALSGSGVEEALDLRQFGPMTATRAGQVEFDAETQTWGWRTANREGTERCTVVGFLTRGEAVADEVATLSSWL